MQAAGLISFLRDGRHRTAPVIYTTELEAKKVDRR